MMLLFGLMVVERVESLILRDTALFFPGLPKIHWSRIVWMSLAWPSDRDWEEKRKEGRNLERRREERYWHLYAQINIYSIFNSV